MTSREELRHFMRQWSDFSFRIRPKKIEKFQAGQETKDVKQKYSRTGDQGSRGRHYPRGKETQKQTIYDTKQESSHRKKVLGLKANGSADVFHYEIVQFQRITRSMQHKLENIFTECNTVTQGQPALTYRKGKKRKSEPQQDISGKHSAKTSKVLCTKTIPVKNAKTVTVKNASNHVDIDKHLTNCQGVATSNSGIRSKRNLAKKSMVISEGTVIWGKILKTRWWPGVTFDGVRAGMGSAKDGHVWIMWFGDHLITQMKINSMEIFSKHYLQRCSGRLPKLLQRAVTEAIQICTQRVDFKLEDSKREEFGAKIEWFLNKVLLDYTNQDPSLPREDEELPEWVLSKLQCLKEKRQIATLSEPGQKCFSCKGFYKVVCQHPLFEGEICKECKDMLLEGLYAMDVDGSDLFCCICGLGDGSVLFVCSKENCKRSFCAECLRIYLIKDLFQKVEGKTNWTCFLCTPFKKETHGMLKPHINSQETALHFFHTFPVSNAQPLIDDELTHQTDRLHVLSLCDGIGTLKSVLNDLDLEVETYHASEVSTDALCVSSVNHGDFITQIGDMKRMGIRELQSICPLNLIVCSPPDPSLVMDPELRVDLNDGQTTVLLLRFAIIVKNLEILAEDRCFFWLLETTPALPETVKTGLSNVFDMEPCVWSCEFSDVCPYIKPRLYWTNIPDVYIGAAKQSVSKQISCRVKQDWTKLLGKVEHRPENITSKFDKDLKPSKDSTEHLNTKSKRQSVNTGPNNSSSVIVNKEDKNGEVSELTETEANDQLDKMESLMGFPRGYTANDQLSYQQRARLLKEASCPHLLTCVLQPLTKYFKRVKDDI